MGKSTVGTLCNAGGEGHQHSPAVQGHLPGRDLDSVVAGFAAMGFPICEGAIDSTHIPIWAPDHWATQYINWKGYFSMVLQALVNHHGQFTDILIGWAGEAHDTCIFCNSSLYQKLEAGTFFPERSIRVGYVNMPLCIMGDTAYPLMLWTALMAA
nr:putative nuclease HARBI1 [Pelodiscus sinensis]|eukprot:XP_025037626.1 putative nuclease HARBI1 [Pelodiscus sinensis]